MRRDRAACAEGCFRRCSLELYDRSRARTLEVEVIEPLLYGSVRARLTILLPGCIGWRKWKRDNHIVYPALTVLSTRAASALIFEPMARKRRTALAPFVARYGKGAPVEECECWGAIRWRVLHRRTGERADRGAYRATCRARGSVSGCQDEVGRCQY